MGLPSGVQWASCNIGAAEPTDLGLYFSWGNIVGHSIDEGYNFSLDVYNSTPAAGINTDLSLDHDAARAYLGDPWRMPSAAEFQELYDNCTYEFSTLKGVNGLLFTSNVNGNKIFFPAAGDFSGTSLRYRGSAGLYRSSTYVDELSAIYLLFSSTNVEPQMSGSRSFGFSVRAVLLPT